MIRGVVALGESLAIGFRALAISANYAAQDPEAKEGEVQTEITRGQILFSFAIAIGFALMLFKVTPGADHELAPDRHDRRVRGDRGRHPRLRLPRLPAADLAPARPAPRLPVPRRRAQGDQRLEASDELTPERVQRYWFIHPRCGTAFLLWVMVIGIFVFAFVGQPAWYWLILSRILLCR